MFEIMHIIKTFSSWCPQLTYTIFILIDTASDHLCLRSYAHSTYARSTSRLDGLEFVKGIYGHLLASKTSVHFMCNQM